MSTLTIDPLQTPLQVSERARLADLDAMREALAYIDGESTIDPIGTTWVTIHWKPDYCDSLEAQRDSALRFLRRHTRTFKRWGKVEKKSDDYQYEVYVALPGGARIRAVAYSSMVCEMVDTGETEVIPAKPAEPAKVVPKLKKVCPPSLLADGFSQIDAGGGVASPSSPPASTPPASSTPSVLDAGPKVPAPSGPACSPTPSRTSGGAAELSPSATGQPAAPDSQTEVA